MGFTLLNLGPPIDALFDTCISDRKNLITKLKDEKDPTKLVKANRDTMVNCIQKCENEIDRQVAIYVKEEKEYAEIVMKCYEAAKKTSEKLIADLAALKTKFNEDTYSTMSPMLKSLREIIEVRKKHGIDLAAHQGFRADPGWDAGKGASAVGPESEHALKKRFIDGRTPGIAATANLAPKIEKMNEFDVRCTDCVKTAAALKSDTAASIKELAAEAEKLLEDTKTFAGSTKDSLNRTQTALKDLNQAPVNDANKLKAAEGKLTASELQFKNLKNTQKTLGLRANNFPDKAKNVVQNPPQKEAVDMLKKLAEAHRFLKQMGEDLAGLHQTRENLSKLITQRKTPQKK